MLALSHIPAFYIWDRAQWAQNYSILPTVESLIPGIGSPGGIHPPWHLQQGKGHLGDFWRMSGITQVLDEPTEITPVCMCYIKLRKNRSGYNCNDPDTREFKILGQGGEQEGQ